MNANDPIGIRRDSMYLKADLVCFFSQGILPPIIHFLISLYRSKGHILKIDNKISFISFTYELNEMFL